MLIPVFHSFIIDCSDDLTSITLDALTEAVKSSVMVILFLDDETHQSSWVIHEINTAKENGIPIVTVIDQDRYPQVRKLPALLYVVRCFDFCSCSFTEGHHISIPETWL